MATMLASTPVAPHMLLDPVYPAVVPPGAERPGEEEGQITSAPQYFAAPEKQHVPSTERSTLRVLSSPPMSSQTPSHAVDAEPAPPIQPPNQDPEHRPDMYFEWGRLYRMSARDKIILLAYFPFGCALGTMRLTVIPLVFMLMTIFQSRPFLVRTMYRFLVTVVLGFRIKINGKDLILDENGKWKSGQNLIIANHISENDIFPISVITPVAVVAHHKFSVFENGIFKIWTGGLFRHAIRPIYTNVSANKARTDVREAVQKVITMGTMPLLVFPEGALTNGRGLLMFHKYVFSDEVGRPITPIALATRYPIPVAIDTVHATSKMNFVWRMFVPYQTYDMTIIEPQTKLLGEGDIDYARRVQALMAAGLSIAVTPYSNRDKYALVDAWKLERKESRLSIKGGKPKGSRLARHGSRVSVGRSPALLPTHSQNPVSVHVECMAPPNPTLTRAWVNTVELESVRVIRTAA